MLFRLEKLMSLCVRPVQEDFCGTRLRSFKSLALCSIFYSVSARKLASICEDQSISIDEEGIRLPIVLDLLATTLLPYRASFPNISSL
jgi:hypothetical protein